MLNYGEPAGIGGVASYWMVFLQQAGGKLYGDDGMPVFNDAPGLEALQLMVDMYTNGSTDPGSISYVGINDATNVLTAGQRLDDDELAVHVEAGQRSGDLQDRRQARYGGPPRRIGGDRLHRRHRRLDDRQDFGQIRSWR